jgi:hypothetical protein
MKTIIVSNGSLAAVLKEALGEYVGRIYKQSQGRPLYIVEGYYGYGSEEHPNRTRSPIRKIE